MPVDLLTGARQQAERSEPPVRAAALLRIARVETATNPGQARRTFQQALEESRRLPSPDRELLLEQAQLLAAAVAPDLVRDLPPLFQGPRFFLPEMLGRIMLDHQHVDAAYDFVMRNQEPSTFPFAVVSTLTQRLDSEERQLAVFRRAIEAWRAAPEIRFLHLFQAGWKILPPDEARAVAQEIVRVTLSQPEWAITATYDQEQTVRITSGRQHTLFTILHLLRRLDPPLAESLIRDHEQLAAAAHRFPKGTESVMEEAQQRRSAAPGATSGGGFAMAGSSRDFPYMRSLFQATKDGDFGPAIDHALEQYRDDAAPENPNQSPHEFWPSTCRFRAILYRAAKRLGPDAGVYLDRIPDADLRLFAQIEFAAALAGLPELQGSQRQQRRPRPR